MAGSIQGGIGSSARLYAFKPPLVLVRREGARAVADGSRAAPTRARSRNSEGICFNSSTERPDRTRRAPAAWRIIQWCSNLRVGLGGTWGPPLSSVRKRAWPCMSSGAYEQSSTCACGSGLKRAISSRPHAQKVHGQRGHCNAKQSAKSLCNANGEWQRGQRKESISDSSARALRTRS